MYTVPGINESMMDFLLTLIEVRMSLPPYISVGSSFDNMYFLFCFGMGFFCTLLVLAWDVSRWPSVSVSR